MGQPNLEVKRRYRESHREELRAKGRAYAAERRRAEGMPALGTPESTENRRRARKLKGPDHPNWKGDDVGYFALHVWVNRHKNKTGRCSNCGDRPVTRTDWANVSGQYLRELDDY